MRNVHTASFPTCRNIDLHPQQKALKVVPDHPLRFRNAAPVGISSKDLNLGKLPADGSPSLQEDHALLDTFMAFDMNRSLPSRSHCKIHKNRLFRWDFAPLNHILTPSAASASG